MDTESIESTMPNNNHNNNNNNNNIASQTEKKECSNIDESHTLGSLTNLLRGAYIAFDEASPSL